MAWQPRRLGVVTMSSGYGPAAHAEKARTLPWRVRATSMVRSTRRSARRRMRSQYMRGVVQTSKMIQSDLYGAEYPKECTQKDAQSVYARCCADQQDDSERPLWCGVPEGVHAEGCAVSICEVLCR